jgi:hypothetical protein
MGGRLYAPIVLAALVLVSCATQPPVNEIGKAGRDDLLEALFRYQFEHNASEAQQGVEYYFLSLDDAQDPPPELIARFRAHVPKVRPLSQATVSATGRVTDRASGGLGLIFKIDAIRWIDARTAIADGGYYETGLSSSGNSYRIERRDNTWYVTGDVINWMTFRGNRPGVYRDASKEKGQPDSGWPSSSPRAAQVTSGRSHRRNGPISGRQTSTAARTG